MGRVRLAPDRGRAAKDERRVGAAPASAFFWTPSLRGRRDAAARTPRRHHETAATSQVSGIEKDGVALYVGVGFAILPPQPSSDGLYGFVVTGAGRLVAHGGSRDLVGRTLEDAVRLSNNRRVDGAELARRIVAAGERGGGWISYPWRNARSEPLAQKGAYVVRLERDADDDSGGDLSGGDLSGGDLSSAEMSYRALPGSSEVEDAVLSRRAGRRAIGRETVLYAGVGYFDRRGAPIPEAEPAARTCADTEAGLGDAAAEYPRPSRGVAATRLRMVRGPRRRRLAIT